MKSEYHETLYYWRKGKGICVDCGVEQALIGRVRCAECLEKDSNKHRKIRTEEQNREFSRKQVEKYHRRKAEGVCVRCGKESFKGTLCYEHYVKIRRKYYEKEQQERGLFPQGVRRELGICKWCSEKAMEGKAFCPECYERFINSVSRKGWEACRRKREAGVSHPWDEQNELLFAKRGDEDDI